LLKIPIELRLILLSGATCQRWWSFRNQPPQILKRLPQLSVIRAAWREETSNPGRVHKAFFGVTACHPERSEGPLKGLRNHTHKTALQSLCAVAAGGTATSTIRLGDPSSSARLGMTGQASYFFFESFFDSRLDSFGSLSAFLDSLGRYSSCSAAAKAFSRPTMSSPGRRISRASASLRSCSSV
jgi:hypothetical protein